MIREKPWYVRARPAVRLMTVLFLALWGSIGRPSAVSLPYQDEGALSVRDDLDRVVTIPRTVEKVISLQPEATRILAALGCADRLVGIDYFLTRYDPVFLQVCPRARDLPVVAYQDASVNLERVVQLGPDLIIASPYDSHIPDSLQAKAGVPVVALSSLGRFEKLVEEIRLIGRLMGRTGRASELIAFIRETTGRVSRAAAGVPAERRPLVYLAFWSSLVRTPVDYDPVTLAGGRNAADLLAGDRSVSDRTVVPVEQIVRWDPDIILVHGNYAPSDRAVTVEGVLDDARLRSVKAVRDKRVYYTFGFWSWWDPAQVLIETLYLGKAFHPSLFRDVDLAREGRAIYGKVYGSENGYAALCRSIRCDEWLKD